ncbi:MAG TPA: hypothetical protein VK427_05170, partial [Kofleriaceae bacterium]|nr:hypothetical protein [Kofleriaceae bacterium]
GFRIRAFPLEQPRPYLAVTIQLGDSPVESSTTIIGYVLANVYYTKHNVRIPNRAPADERLDYMLECDMEPAPTEKAARVEREISRVFAALGWTRIHAVELAEQAPGLVAWSVQAALEADPHGWLDGNPREDEHDSDVLAYRDQVATIYSAPEEIAARSRMAPAWQSAFEQLVTAYGQSERLTPDKYPSVGWTIDFGEVREAGFHARFLTDIYASKLAPLWFFAHRFIVDNPDPEPRVDPLEGWSVGEIGYTRTQDNCLRAIRELLAIHGLVELDPYIVTYSISLSDDSTECRTFNEWLFRDPRGLANPAPRLEEEHPNREIQIRRGGLRG